MNKRIEITKKVRLTLTADDWELYHIVGRNAAARALNMKIAAALNSNDRVAASRALTAHSEHGADDTEGHCMLREIIRKLEGN